MKAVDFVWFDFGGVLSPPIPDLFEQYATKTGIQPADLQRAIKMVADDLGVPPLAPIEIAMLSEAEWGANVRRALLRIRPDYDTSAARLENFGEQWFSGVEANSAMTDAAHALKAGGIGVGILTNNVREWEPHWRRIVDLDHVVDIVVDSFREGCRKPDVAFFQIACERSGASPQRSLLIDDTLENVEAASQLGWHTVHFTANDGARAAIERLTLVPIQSQRV